jgi:hypothetical protein
MLKVKDAMIPDVGLKELEIGDIFYNIMDKHAKKFVVRGSAVFNERHGSPVRMCMSIKDGQLVSKSCRINVRKIGESKFKEQYKQKPINKL